MTIREYYEKMGADYDDAFGRLMKDERILKYLRMFAAGKDLEQFDEALAAENYEDAFRFVHNLKGVSLNLGLTPLAKSSSVLCDALRHGKPTEDISGMIAAVKEDHAKIVGIIAEIG